ncbi:MAG: choice-of-anchor K domain-containing protein [Cyanobacteria bacterium P01_A01_bin.123]
MRHSKFSLILSSAVAITAMGGVATPSYAFSLNGTSASFDNALLSNGTTVGKAATNDAFGNYEQAASNYSDDNYVEFIEVNGVTQVRWGDPVYSSYNFNSGWWDYTHVDTQQGGYGYTWDYGDVHLNGSDHTLYHDDHVDFTANKSGLGFAGVNSLDLTVGQVFNIGTLKHYNNTIWGDGSGRDATKAEFSLNLDFDDASIGQQKFDFSLSVDETNNAASAHAGGVCPYETTGHGCSDKITWDFAMNSQNSFEYEGTQYTLELVGFSDNPDFEFDANTLDNFAPTTQFISQERGTSQASIYARIVEMGDYSDIPADVPEPTTMLGLGVIGAFFVKSRRKRNVQAA